MNYFVRGLPPPAAFHVGVANDRHRQVAGRLLFTISLPTPATRWRSVRLWFLHGASTHRAPDGLGQYEARRGAVPSVARVECHHSATVESQVRSSLRSPGLEAGRSPPRSRMLEYAGRRVGTIGQVWMTCSSRRSGGSSMS